MREGESPVNGEGTEILAARSGLSQEIRLLAVLVSLLMLGLVDAQLLAPILLAVAEELGVSASWVGRTVSGYAVAAALAALVVGPLSDRRGRKPFLVLGGAVFAVGSAAVAASPSFSVFALGRVVTGAGAGVISALVVAAIADLVPYERRGRAMGWVATAYFAAPILGVPVAAWVADLSGWRTNYVAFCVLGLACAATVLFQFREPKPAGSSSRRGGYLRFLRARDTAAGALSAFFVTGGLTGFLLFLGAYLGERFGLSVTEVGLVFLLCGVAGLFGALGAGRIADRFGNLRLARGGSFVLALALVVVPRFAGLALYLALAVVGLAAASRMAPLQSLVTELVDKESRGAYVALRNTLSQSGNAAAAALAATLYERGFVHVCWMAAGFSLAALLLLLLIEEPRRAEG